MSVLQTSGGIPSRPAVLLFSMSLREFCNSNIVKGPTCIGSVLLQLFQYYFCCNYPMIWVKTFKSIESCTAFDAVDPFLFVTLKTIWDRWLFGVHFFPCLFWKLVFKESFSKSATCNQLEKHLYLKLNYHKKKSVTKPDFISCLIIPADKKQ